MRSSDLFVAAVPCVLLACVGWPSALTAADVSAPQAAHAIQINVPVKMEKAKVVLLKQGVQIEECAVSMKAHSWGNEDLLPGIKVNTGAVIRLIQLTQEGYTQIQP